MNRLAGVLIGAAIVIAIASFFIANQSNDFIVSTKNLTNNINNTVNETILNNNTNSSNIIIEIKNFAFVPNIITIKKGQTITWINRDQAAHTVTSDTGKELSSRILMENQTYEHKFQFDGTYEYHCEFHKTMKAKVIVE
jgi:plastocyanin